MKTIQKHPNYGVTSCGKVYNYKTKKFLKGYWHEGYYCVELDDKQYRVHRLVAEAYLPNPNNYDTVDHIDNDKTHNYLNNLQWLSRENNVRKAQNKKVRCVETGQVFNSQTEAANWVGKHKQGITNCIKGRAHTCGGYHWEAVK